MRECPEGIAQKFDHAIVYADMALAHGLPDGKPFNQQDARTMQLIEAVRALRSEE